MSTVISNQEAATFLGANLARILRSRSMSIRGLAAATGEDPTQISRIARGPQVPNIAVVARIAEALDVSIDALLRRAETVSAN